jgi:hypothetical protein
MTLSVEVRLAQTKLGGLTYITRGVKFFEIHPKIIFQGISLDVEFQCLEKGEKDVLN